MVRPIRRRTPSGLYDRDRDRRPKKITEEVEEKIERLLEGDPTEEGENATRWTTDRIAEYLDRELDVDVHPETVRDALNRLKYSWTRPRRELPPTDPEAYQKRLSAIVESVAEADEETSVLVEDETILKRFPPLRRIWQPVGEQRAVWVPEENDDFTLYSSLDLTSGQTYIEAFEKDDPTTRSNTWSRCWRRPQARCFSSGTKQRGIRPVR